MTVVTTVISAGAGLALMATSVGRQALVDQWERTAVAFGQNVDDEAYARLEALSDRSAAGYGLLSALIGGPALTVAVASLVKVAFRGGATFGQVMAVATTSSAPIGISTST